MTSVNDILKNKGYEVSTIRPEKTVYEALQLMHDKDIGAVLVTENDKLLGIFSERDYARKLILYGLFSKETLVKDMMTKELMVVAPADNIAKCMELMTDKKVRHLPVVDKGKLVGLISIGDLVKAIIHLKDNEIKSLTGYISGHYGYGTNE
jgi:CBS domain-containing protein